MKKSILLFGLILLNLSVFSQATLYWRYANPQVVTGSPDKFKFDIEVKSSVSTTFLSGGLVYNFNQLVFGNPAIVNITKGTSFSAFNASPVSVAAGKVTYEQTDFSNTGVVVTTTYLTFCSVTMDLNNLCGTPGIEFNSNDMNGTSFYDPINFYTYTNVYENDLLSFFGNTPASTSWVGGVSSDWNDHTNWTDCVPGATTDVLIGIGTYPAIANNNVTVADLTIQPGGALTVNPAFTLTVNGSLLIESDATGTGYLIHNNSGVAATVERYLSQTKYHYVSSPISNATNALLQGTLGVDDFWEWNEVGNLWNNLNAAGVNSSGALNVAQGYAVAYKNSETTKSFVGTLNTGDKSFPATFTNTWMQKGYNFVGNPYASAISAPTFISQNPLLAGGLYFWDETSNYNGVRWDYATYTLVGGASGGGAGNVPNGFIAPSQGFMVKVTAAGNVNFKNNMRVTDAAPFFKSGKELSRTWLSVTGPEGDYNEILAGFIEDGQEGVDITDAVKLKGNDKLAFYMLLEGNDYVIQGLPAFDLSKSYALPLGIDAGFVGNYTFKLREIENFDPQVLITLEDKLTGTFFDLRGNAQYVAQIADAGEIRDRFVMHINGVTAISEIGQQLTKVYSTNSQVFVELNGNNKILDVEVINTLGQTVLKTSVNASEASFNLNGANVVYIVKVRTSQGVETHKILLH